MCLYQQILANPKNSQTGIYSGVGRQGRMFLLCYSFNDDDDRGNRLANGPEPLLSKQREAPMSWTVVNHYCDVIMGAMASQITSLTIVESTVHSGADQRKHQSSALLTFVREFHRWPVNSSHKWPVTRKMFQFGDVIMYCWYQEAVSIRKTVLPGMAIPMLKIRRPNGRLIFNMEIAIRR